jgi:hypothetical protein
MGFNAARKAARLARRKKNNSQVLGQAIDDAVPSPAPAAPSAPSAASAGSSIPISGEAGASSFFIDPNKGVLGNLGARMGGQLTQKFGDGWGIAKQAGKHALRGAVGGAALGGTTEWAQGGSFWQGAKQGAFNGAVGWSAYRMAGHATGATGRNPFSKNGAIAGVANQYGGVSKQVKAIATAKAASAQAAKNNGLNV